MWSSVGEYYPLIIPLQAPQGMVVVIEPKTETKNSEYYPIQPPGKPYQIINYTTRKWVI